MSKMTARVTTNFSRSEFTHSQTAARHGIENEPSEMQWRIISGMANTILEPLRTRVGPIYLSSGYRCPELNVKIGGAKHSDHQILGTACAVDIVSDNLGELFRSAYWFPWSRLIWEYGRWVHISWDSAGRPHGAMPRIKTKTRDYEFLDHEEICQL